MSQHLKPVNNGLGWYRSLIYSSNLAFLHHKEVTEADDFIMEKKIFFFSIKKSLFSFQFGRFRAWLSCSKGPPGCCFFMAEVPGLGLFLRQPILKRTPVSRAWWHTPEIPGPRAETVEERPYMIRLCQTNNKKGLTLIPSEGCDFNDPHLSEAPARVSTSPRGHIRYEPVHKPLGHKPHPNPVIQLRGKGCPSAFASIPAVFAWFPVGLPLYCIFRSSPIFLRFGGLSWSLKKGKLPSGFSSATCL